MRKELIVLFFSFLFAGPILMAQVTKDTLRLNLAEAEKMFLDSNLQLLAQRYNIDAQKALIIQARLWPNPNLSVSRGPLWGINNPTATFFYNSENAAGLSQLILLAGKRNKQIRLAQANAKLAEYQFFDLMRTLKYTLRSDFFNIYYLQRSALVYNDEINSLELVTKAFAEQEGKGYIAEKEVVRIKAQLYSLQSEYNDLVNQINDQQSELKLVLQAGPSQYITPIVDSLSMNSLNPGKYPLNELLDSALKNRTDLLIARTNTDINKLNYNYQKALAVPDLTLSLAYDEQGSYVTNFQSIGASIDLPFFNRNQGNIKSAKAMIDFSNASQRSTEATVQQNVARALEKAFAQDKLFQQIDRKFSGDFQRLMQAVLENYQKRNISILEFLDFYDSYKENILQINSIQYNRVGAFEDINFYTGTNFFN
jgi:cobalt-zinc-cadmium efflux system outer membrane protein